MRVLALALAAQGALALNIGPLVTSPTVSVVPSSRAAIFLSEEMSATEKAVEMASPTATASKPKRVNNKKKVPYLERLKGPSKAYLGREVARKNREAAAQKAAEAAAREAAAEAAAAAEAEAPAEEASE